MVILAKIETTPVDITPAAVRSNAGRLMRGDVRRRTSLQSIMGTNRESSYSCNIRIESLHPHLTQISYQLPFRRLTFLGLRQDHDFCSMERHRSSRSGAS